MKKPRGRWQKYATAVDRIKEAIVSGELKPGDTLPQRKELEIKLGMTTATLQRAINVLIQDGFVTARRGIGTRVAASPPHLAVTGVVIPRLGSQAFTSLLWKTASSVVNRYESSADHRLQLYEGSLDMMNEDDRRLESDVLAHRVGSLIFCTNPRRYSGSPILTRPGLQRVAWTSHTAPNGEFVSLFPDYEAFIDMAVRELAHLGKKRIAVISDKAVLNSSTQDRLIRTVAEVGAVTYPKWHQSVLSRCGGAAIPLVLLLMDNENPNRPDGLIIMDDNLTDSVATGLEIAGARVPYDVAVISYANFPSTELHLRTRIQLLGCNIEAMVEKSCAYIAMMRRGEQPPPVTYQTPVYLEEYLTKHPVQWRVP